MTDKAKKPQVTKQRAVELDEAKLDKVAGGATASITDGTSNTASLRESFPRK